MGQAIGIVGHFGPEEIAIGHRRAATARCRRSPITLVDNGRRLRSSTTLVDNDHRLRSSITIIDYDHRLRSSITIMTAGADGAMDRDHR